MSGATPNAAGHELNREALEPLFEPWEEPNKHRVRDDEHGGAKVVKGRRPSALPIVQSLRAEVRQWREVDYVGASDTTRHLLNHWFARPHRRTTPAGDEFEFRYYFCQREAVETLIYLKEVRGIECLSQLIFEFGDATDREVAALGTTEDEDAWSRYAFKLATGAGKTKVMSLAVVWSYFHSLRESDSPMARHFVVIAPNLTVYERLKEDFGDGRIFDADPLIPTEWRGDWNMSVVLQDEASGAATGGVLYLTNIHRLYDTSKRKSKKDAETYDWIGPAVSKSTALDTGKALRERITSHRRVMVLNDEAHHVWDPNSAWNEAIKFLHDAIFARTGGRLVAQLDLTATPKDDKGRLFKHIVCDAPLGEAVDGGIVKTPLIGVAGDKLTEQASDNASERYERHLMLGYKRWQKSRDEWAASGKKSLLFVMCEDTQAADEIADRLNTDSIFKDLNGKTINLHTNLKGKVKKVGKGANARLEFVENDREISDEDLAELRKLSRNLDSNQSQYSCIVSVLMLREGWDVRNVCTIVPLRPYSAKSEVLPEQTLGRGLRRMTPPGSQGAVEVVTVVEHPAFANLYKQELAQQGVIIAETGADDVPATTVSIFPDRQHKDVAALEIAIPTLTAAHRMVPNLDGLTEKDVRAACKKLVPLPLGKPTGTEVDYEGRHLFTGEVVEKMKIELPLLDSGIGAISYYVKQLETICKIRGIHKHLAPLVEMFFTDILFGPKQDLFDPKLVSRLGDADVASYVRDVFVPLIRSKTTVKEERIPGSEPVRLSNWKPFQVTHSDRRPAIPSPLTLFNLVPCNRELEVAFTKFATNAADVAAFAKNAGPQCLRIDFLAEGNRLAFYTPDFFVRDSAGNYFLVETKGREDRDVPRKARAAVAWCESASQGETKWRYLYVPEGIFGGFSGNTIEELARVCEPHLTRLVDDERVKQELPLFAALSEAKEKAPDFGKLVDKPTLDALPLVPRQRVIQAVTLFQFMQNKPDMEFSPVFSSLLGVLDDAAREIIFDKLEDSLPHSVPEQKAWFTPYVESIKPVGDRKHYEQMAQNLKRTLVFYNGVSPIGLLRNCLDFALNDRNKPGGTFDAIATNFKFAGARDLLDIATRVNDFRNTHVAHQENPLTDSKAAEVHLQEWIQALVKLVAMGPMPHVSPASQPSECPVCGEAKPLVEVEHDGQRKFMCESCRDSMNSSARLAK